MDNRYALENAIYISNEQTISPHLKATYGLRYSLFSSIGPGTVYTYDQVADVVDSVPIQKEKYLILMAELNQDYCLIT